MTMFTRPANPAAAAAPESTTPAATAETVAKRPLALSPSNWPVRYKVLAIVLVPLILATAFGALRVKEAVAGSHDLRLAAARADVVPAITKYMSALDVALLASSTGRDLEGAKKNYQERKDELQSRLADTDVTPDVRSGVSTLLNAGQGLLDKVADNSIGLPDRVTTYAPILLTAEDVISASVRLGNERIRAEAQGLSRAVGARGQMTMQEILLTRGADLPEPQLRTSMITLAGTEPSTLFGMSEVLGAGSSEAKTLQQQMVTRMALMSDPATPLVDNPDLLRSIRTTDGIAEQVIADATTSVTKSVHAAATDARNAAIVDAAVVLVAIVIALGIVLLMARALVRPLRVLRDGALKVAHTDLEEEVARVKAGAGEPIPQPLPINTTEEIGQVAHAVDELHTRALLLAGDEARLRLLVNDMFETMSRRSRSLVDQQLALIDRLERNEHDPQRLDKLFRLDHLAARLRRNSANLLVLAGAQLARDQRDPVPLVTVINAAVSEVEDYRRVEITGLPDCMVVGAAAGGVIHLFAELIDNALRYSPPTTSVQVSAAPGGDGAVVVRISDSGLGMNEADRRIANMRLRAGGDVTPENARHMGLFVVGRIAARHGIRVGLRGPGFHEAGTGTTAEVYLPPPVFEGSPVTSQLTGAPHAPGGQAAPVVPAPTGDADERHAEMDPANQNGSERSGPPVTLLPRRNPGSSGITDVPTGPPTQQPPPPRRELATPWWQNERENGKQSEQSPEPRQAPAATPAVSDTSAFFAARAPKDTERAETAVAGPAGPDAGAPAEPMPSAREEVTSADDDVIYRRMLSEMLGDPYDLVNSPDLDWQSVWDRGWSLAAAAEDKPVESHTSAHGLPVREPGARLVPGAAQGAGVAERDPSDDDQEPLLESNGGSCSARQPEDAGVTRDPEAVRASFSSHFGGVRSARAHARNASEGPDQQ
ncbi:ATP-binding protein [Mycobacterium sp.]|uniref:ATP-binding protein n=1 Tax=Mycobacterium sp. TaxID=1785 RepID=UPI0025D533C3|nr:ATP-binding protein [Mycobacterium sp.]MBW0012453.1 HAMP domain-containing protein [Mycobacterium sp.]